MPENEPQTLRECFDAAERQRKALDRSTWTDAANVQEKLSKTIALYEQAIHNAGKVSLFSSNETLEDVTSSNIQFFLLHFRLAELILQLTGSDREKDLQRAQAEYENFLHLIDSYRLLGPQDVKLYEQYQAQPDLFSTASTVDATARRATKIARFREEKALKSKLELLEKDPRLLIEDDTAFRNLHITHIMLSVYQSFQSLESIGQELQVRKLVPPGPTGAQSPQDERSPSQLKDAYSDRLDQPFAGLNKQGPILSKDGKLLRPFTLLDKRQTLQSGVFRPDHNLPTMTIDEYLEEERRRGGIIEGGGPSSGIKPEIDEDNHPISDAQTLKQRQWDDWKDDNPRGAGNTMNMG